YAPANSTPVLIPPGFGVQQPCAAFPLDGSLSPTLLTAPNDRVPIAKRIQPSLPCADEMVFCGWRSSITLWVLASPGAGSGRSVCPDLQSDPGRQHPRKPR